MERYVFNPFTFIAIIILFGLLLILIPLFFLGVVGGALTNLGFSWGEALLILFLILIGSLINIPVKKIENRCTMPLKEYRLYGMIYRIPQTAGPFTLVAINVGGALIPALISIYLFYEAYVIAEGFRIVIAALAGVVIVALVTHRVSQPVQGLGIATPFFIPPLCALFCGIVLSWGVPFGAPIVAYISGTLGTLIGADLLNLDRLCELGAPVASIGGAGTFDGVFLSGIIAAFLA